MPNDRILQLCRSSYATLLRLYPRPFYERFAGGMAQTFNDLLRERSATGGNPAGLALWLFAETLAGVIKENINMRIKTFMRPAVITGCMTLIPLLGNLFVDGWDWSPADFIIWACVVFGTALAYELISASTGVTSYRAAAAIAVLAAFLIIWINLAVGIIGSEDNPANMMYLAVLAVEFLGVCLARLRPHGMARAMLATASVLALLAVVAFVGNLAAPENPPIQVLSLNMFFVALFAGSALLFHHASRIALKPAAPGA